MTNKEKYQLMTIVEAIEEFRYDCVDCLRSKDCANNSINCFVHWLNKEANKTLDEIIEEIRNENPVEHYPAEYGGGEIPNKMRVLAKRLEIALAEERRKRNEQIHNDTMRKDIKIVGYLNHHEVAEAIITEKEFDDFKTKEGEENE